MNIGAWVRRTGGKWHLVESVVDGDAITRCGRRMDRVTRSGGDLQVSEVMPLTRMIGQPQLCRRCDNAAPLMASVTGRQLEDDASTHGEVAES